MKLQGLVCFALLVVLNRTVNLSPVLPNEGVGRSKANTIEDLFFISEKDEKTLDKETLNIAILEKIKSRILRGLNLTEAPKSHPPIPPLQTFLRIHTNKVWRNSGSIVFKKQARQHLKSAFLTSEIIPNTCFDRTGPQCVRFQVHIPNHLSIKNSLSELWLYKRNGTTEFKFSQIIDVPGRSELKKELFLITNQSASAGWIRFDASILLGKLSSNVLDVEVFSNSMSIPIEIGKDKNPLLVILFKSTEKGRTKRTVVSECSEETTSCCMQVRYVSFQDVGYDEWIVQPEGYYANICRGSCNNILSAGTLHAQLIMTLMSRKNNSELGNTINCTPKTYKPLSIIYTDEKGMKVISNLPDMAVAECACS